MQIELDEVKRAELVRNGLIVESDVFTELQGRDYIDVPIKADLMHRFLNKPFAVVCEGQCDIIIVQLTRTGKHKFDASLMVCRLAKSW